MKGRTVDVTYRMTNKVYGELWLHHWLGVIFGALMQNLKEET